MITLTLKSKTHNHQVLLPVSTREYLSFLLIKKSTHQRLGWNNKKLDDICEITTIQGQYPSNTTVITGDSIINGIREERLSGKYGAVKVRNFPGATIDDMQKQIMLNLILQEKF